MIQAAVMNVIMRRDSGIDLHPAYRIGFTQSLHRLLHDLEPS
jgi:hypothetical protein